MHCLRSFYEPLLAMELGNKVGSTGNTGYGGSNTDSLLASDPTYEVNQYFVHPDHLGSSSHITDITGEVYQHTEYLPFGEIFVEERNTQQDRFSYLYNGKELDEMTGLYYFGARFFDARIGQFLGVDPITEKFAYLSPYNYASNNPSTNIDLWGLQGVKFTDVNNEKTIEKNVVVLTERHKAIPEGAEQKQIDKITRQNERIDARNTAKVNYTQTRLNNTYNGSDGRGSKNSAGETVMFKFNVSGSPTNNTDGGTARQVTSFGIANGITSSETDFTGANKIAPAAVVTKRSAGGSQGLSNGIFVTESGGAPEITLSHEVGHTFQLRDNYPSSTGGLMDYPPGGLIPSEVDEIWDKSYAK